MRKRSNALNSSSLESYIKISKMVQSDPKIFSQMYENDLIEASSMTSSKKQIKNENFFENFNFSSTSTSLRKPNANCELSKKHFLTNEETQIDEKILTKIIMIAGTENSGKRNFIRNLFDDQKFDCNAESKYALDFMVAHKTESNQRKNYKFWLHNLNERKYLDIVDMYYKCADLVIFLLDLSSEENINAIKQNYFHIRNKLTQKNFKFLLIGLEKGVCNEKNYRKANDFAEENKFLGFLLYKSDNSLIKETILEIIS